MLRRIYIHNYRCFENFELKFTDQTSVLILGKNGTGKSSLISALRVLQRIAKGDNRVKQVVMADDFAFNRTEVPLRIEITAELDDKTYEYSIAFELPEGFKEARVRDEKLVFDGNTIYARTEAQVELQAGNGRFLVDWHIVALPVVQLRGTNNPLETFRSWLSRMVLISPVPSLMQGVSNEESLYPDKHVSNFADWFSGVLGAYPASYSIVDSFLKQSIPDFLDFQNKSIGESAKKVIVRFGVEKRIIPIEFNQLSDGEKIFLVCAVLLGANGHYDPTFCVWDEPENYVSLSEVGHMVIALRRSFMRSGQLFITSHNPEAIRKFSDESTVYLDRRSHLEPTQAKWLHEFNYSGNLIDSLIRGDFGNGG